MGPYSLCHVAVSHDNLNNAKKSKYTARWEDLTVVVVLLLKIKVFWDVTVSYLLTFGNSLRCCMLLMEHSRCLDNLMSPTRLQVTGQCRNELLPRNTIAIFYEGIS